MAIAIPNLLRSAQVARETTAHHEVLTIGRAQLLYSITRGNGRFTNLRTLGTEGLIDSSLASGQKGGYLFSSEPLFFEGTPMFDTTAKPVEAGTVGTARRSFGSNETLVIYEAEGIVNLRGTPSNRAPAGGTPLD
jgi:hypothetical protein